MCIYYYRYLRFRITTDEGHVGIHSEIAQGNVFYFCSTLVFIVPPSIIIDPFCLLASLLPSHCLYVYGDVMHNEMQVF